MIIKIILSSVIVNKNDELYKLLIFVSEKINVYIVLIC